MDKKTKVVSLYETTDLEIPADRVLEGAIDKLDVVLVAGWEKDTGELYLASSTPSVPNMLWLVEKFKQWLLQD